MLRPGTNPDIDECELTVVKTQLEKSKAPKVLRSSSRVFPSQDNPELSALTTVTVIPQPPITVQFNMSTTRNAALNISTDTLPSVEELPNTPGVTPAEPPTTQKPDSPSTLNQPIQADVESKDDKRENNSVCVPGCCKMM